MNGSHGCGLGRLVLSSSGAIGPCVHRLGAEKAQGCDWDEMTVEMKCVGNRCVDEMDFLRRFGRFEALHFPLSTADREFSARLFARKPCS